MIETDTPKIYEKDADFDPPNLVKSLKNIFEVDLYGLGGPEVNANTIATPPEIDYQDLHLIVRILFSQFHYFPYVFFS